MENDRTWDKSIKEIECHLNNAHNKTINDTTIHVLYGYYLSFRDGVLRHATTAEVWNSSQKIQTTIRERIDREHQMWKQRYDSKHVKPIHYKEGDVVYIRRLTEATGESTKLQVKYRGPLVVTEVLPNYVYRVSELHTDDKRRYATTVHVSHIKGYHIPEDEEEPAEPTTSHEGERPKRERRPPGWQESYQM